MVIQNCLSWIAGSDYEIGEYIKSDRISISIRNVRSTNNVKETLANRPVHVAFILINHRM